MTQSGDIWTRVWEQPAAGYNMRSAGEAERRLLLRLERLWMAIRGLVPRGARPVRLLTCRYDNVRPCIYGYSVKSSRIRCRPEKLRLMAMFTGEVL